MRAQAAQLIGAGPGGLHFQTPETLTHVLRSGQEYVTVLVPSRLFSQMTLACQTRLSASSCAVAARGMTTPADDGEAMTARAATSASVRHLTFVGISCSPDPRRIRLP